jgi:hypothetical protein
MSSLVLQSLIQLIRFDGHIARENFAVLHEVVRTCPVSTHAPLADPIGQICHALDLACIWYWKRVLCLQRSAATVCLLRRYGISAQMVIGAQLLPFKAHAWVEVGGRVVSDKPYLHEIYAVLERC